MKFKLFLQLGFLVTFFSGLVQAGGKKLTDADKTNLFECYKQLGSYTKLSPETKDFMDKYLWQKVQLPNGNTYTLRIGTKGADRPKELVLRCNKSFSKQGKLVTEIFTIDSLLKNDIEFKGWFRGQGLPVPSVPKSTSVVLEKDIFGAQKWEGATVVGLDSSKLSTCSSQVFKKSPKTFTHSLKNNVTQEFLKALKYAEFQQALYKKVADGLELNKAVRSYASSLKGEQHVARAYSTAWQNYAAQSAKSTVSSVAGSTASSIPKTAASFVKAGSFLGAKKAAIAASLGATGLTGYYVFKKQANAEEQSAKLEQPLYTQEKSVKIEKPTCIQQISTFCIQNPGKTVGIAAGTAALGYAAYKLYNSDIFSESKKVAELEK